MRPAATLLVVRDGHDGLEVLMGRRSRAAAFAPGAFVFPGGVVDASDGDRRAQTAAGGMRDPWRIAAIRETFEETGTLVATDVTDVTGADFWSLPAVRSGALHLGRLAYLSTWVTPEFLPRRYDTRFFLTHDCGIPVAADGLEFVELRWQEPEQALTAFRSGLFPAVSPTLAHLEWLAGFSSADAAWDGATAGRHLALVDQAAVEGHQPAGLGIAL